MWLNSSRIIIKAPDYTADDRKQSSGIKGFTAITNDKMTRNGMQKRTRTHTKVISEKKLLMAGAGLAVSEKMLPPQV